MLDSLVARSAENASWHRVPQLSGVTGGKGGEGGEASPGDGHTGIAQCSQRCEGSEV